MVLRLVLATNSSVRQSLQFTFNRVLCKIFGAMSSDSFVMVCIFFGLKPVEELICARQNRFVTRYISSENSLCGLISRKYCWLCFCICDSCLSVNSVLLCVSVLEDEYCIYVCCLLLIICITLLLFLLRVKIYIYIYIYKTRKNFISVNHICIKRYWLYD